MDITQLAIVIAIVAGVGFGGAFLIKKFGKDNPTGLGPPPGNGPGQDDDYR